MSKIILQPCSDNLAFQHFQETVKLGVDLSVIKPFLPLDFFAELEQVYSSGKCYVWGVEPKDGLNAKKWQRIERGDIALFGKNKRVFAFGTVTAKTENIPLALNLWGDNGQGGTWEHIYFLDEIIFREIPNIELNKLLGYQLNSNIQGFNVLSKEKSQKAMNFLELGSDIYLEEVSEEEYNKAVDKLTKLEKTDKKYQAIRRLEQDHLKQSLFGKNTTGRCGICNRLYPISILVVAHIKKRSRCSEEERKNINVVMPLCKMGCDELFERGYIAVENGIITDMNKKPISETMIYYISGINGNTCSYYKYSKAFFEWHYEYHLEKEFKSV